ncbi:MAG: cysteine desulfurase-like protein [Pirellulales bacterium]|nr:cysteine desulfurase-like protein [Pirellulales bacterium]
MTQTIQRLSTTPVDREIASTADIRSQFPALSRIHGGHPVAYFDGPGGTQTPRCVADAMVDYLYNHNANTHWAYPTSAETDEILEQSRAALADFLNASPSEIVFGANATTLAFHISRAVGAQCSPGDEVVITELDHHANVGPWQAMARERDLVLRVVKMDVASGTLDWDDFASKLSPRTKLVAIGAASNALGTVTDVARAAKLAHSVGALAFVDAVHYAPHNLVDVRAINCDFLMCSAYKFYGPHIGVLYCRRELFQSLPFAKVQPSPNTAPDRAETGTLNHEGIAGAAAAVEFFASLAPAEGSRRERLTMAFDVLHARGTALMQRLWNGLAEIKGVTLFGPRPEAPRTSTVAFTVAGVPSREVAERLSDRGIFLSHGDFYAMTVIERLGLGPEGLVRAGCACYTTDEEVDRLIAGVRAL